MNAKHGLEHHFDCRCRCCYLFSSCAPCDLILGLHGPLVSVTVCFRSLLDRYTWSELMPLTGSLGRLVTSGCCFMPHLSPHLKDGAHDAAQRAGSKQQIALVQSLRHFMWAVTEQVANEEFCDGVRKEVFDVVGPPEIPVDSFGPLSARIPMSRTHAGSCGQAATKPAHSIEPSPTHPHSHPGQGLALFSGR